MYLASLVLALAGVACSDDDDGNNTPPPTGDGDGDGDSGDGDGDGDGGDGDGTSFELVGEVGPVEGTADDAQCNETSDTRDEDGCYSFYCGTNSNSIKAGATSNATCGTDAEVYYACEGASSRRAGECARINALRPDPHAATRDCFREDTKLDVITDSCLECYLDSADCARENCASVCLGGHSDDCDKCRQDSGCTPGFYECAGLPDPKE